MNYQAIDQYTYQTKTACFNTSHFFVGQTLIDAIDQFAIVALAETSYSTVRQFSLDRVAINATAKANGAQHATAIRGNLWNYSVDGLGCTGIYGQAVGTDYARWSAALHGETKHLCALDGGVTVGASIEICTYSAKGTPFGLLINNTTGSTGEQILGRAETLNPNCIGISIRGNRFKKGIAIETICDSYVEIQGEQVLGPRIHGFPDVATVTTTEYNRLLAALRKHGILGS